jgi:3-dehydroquinate synthase
LPTRYPGEAWPRLRDAMRIDKKARGARLRFVVLGGLAQPTVLDDPPEELLEAAYAEVSE